MFKKSVKIGLVAVMTFSQCVTLTEVLHIKTGHNLLYSIT